MRLFVVIGGLIALVLLTALIGPYFVDWDQYRDRFEVEASRILGQEVRVEGKASARLLPFPSVTFSDVRVGPRDAPNITVEQFSMDAELAPFLSGEILIFDMRITSPIVRLDLDQQGRPSWDWPSQAPVDPAQISLENASFTDGTLVLRDPYDGRQWDFVALNGTAAADSLFGPWRLDGEGLVRGLPFNTRISTGNLSREGFSVRANMVLPLQKVEITADGRIAPPSGEVSSWYSGTFSLKPDALSEQKYKVEGLFEADARSLDVAQFRADFGDLEDPYSINGAATIVGGVSPRFDFEAKGNQVSLQQTGDAEPLSLNARLAEIQSVLAALPFPPLPGTINLDLPTIVVGKTTIRDVKLSAEPNGNKNAKGWFLKSLTAQLPGRTALEASGALQIGSAAENRFTGDMIVASRQPSGLASWLTNDVDEAIRTLPNAGFSATVDLSAGSQLFDDIELVLGPASLKGRMLRQSPPTSLPSVDVSMSGENANFDTLNALAATFFGRDGSFRLDNHEVDVAMDLSNAIIQDVTIGKLDAAMRVRGDKIEFDRLSLTDIFGASVSATGTLVESGQGDAQVRNLQTDATVLATNGAEFVLGLRDKFGDVAGLDRLVRTARQNPSALRELALNIVGAADIPAKGDVEASASITGKVGGSDLSLTTTIKGDRTEHAAMIASLNGTIDNAETTILLSQLGFEVFPLRLLGEGQMRVNMSGSLNDGLSARFALETPDSLMSTSGVFRNKAASRQFSGTAELKSADIEPWMDLFGYIFPSTGLGTPAMGEARIVFQDKEFELSDLKGEIAENKFSGVLKVKTADAAPSLEGSLRLEDLDAGFLASLLTGKYNLDGTQSLFNAPLYSDHSLDLALQSDGFGIDNAVARDVQMRMIYKDGSLSLSGVKGKSAAGELTGSLDAQNNNGSILLTGQIALYNADFKSLLPRLPETVSANGDISVSFTGSGNSQDALMNSLTGSGAVSAKNVKLPNVNSAAIADILTKADAIGYEITDAQIEEIASSAIVSGGIEIGQIETPISVASGVISISNLAVSSGDVSLQADAKYSLAEGKAAGGSRLTFDAGDESLAGARPEVLLNFEQSIDDDTMTVERDYTQLIAFVRQRALEREQARVEALQARLLEKQRLRRDVRYIRFLEAEKQARIEAERSQKLEEEQLAREAEAARIEALRIQREKDRVAAQEAELAAQRKAAEEKAAQDTLIRSRDALNSVAPNAPQAAPQTNGIFDNLNQKLPN